MLLALVLRDEGLLEEAIQVLQNVVDSNNANSQVFMQLGSFLGDGKKDYDRAVAVMLRGIDRFENDSAFMNNLAYSYLMCGNVSPARALLVRHRDMLSPHAGTDGASRVALTATWGLLYVLEGDLQRGEQFYRNAARLASEIGNLNLKITVLQKMNLELARAFIKDGDRQSAAEYIRQGCSLRGGSDIYAKELQMFKAEIGEDC
jgi:tetratricopeptide (TPR) repeat protein